jgi:3',5'-cyclic AMP phosphodiesterase CpdA
MHLSRRGFLLSMAAGAALRPAVALPEPQPFRLPYLQDLASDHARILWATSDDTVGTVEYWPAGGAKRLVTARRLELAPEETGIARYYQQETLLDGLAPGTQYAYRVLANERPVTEELRFRTAGSGAFQFLVFGDSGQGTEAQAEIARLMEQEAADLVLHTGDVAYTSGTFEEFNRVFFPYYTALMGRVPIFATPGNHDYITREAAPYLSVFAPPSSGVPAADLGRYYSFDWGNAHFVSLDSNTPLAAALEGRGGMLEWLQNDLAATRRFWRFVFFHHPPYASGPAETESEGRAIREHVAPMLDRYGVQLVFNGHHHSYQRSHAIRGGEVVADGGGTVYVTSGGGGGGLYQIAPKPSMAVGESAHHYVRVSVQGAKLELQAIRADGSELDRTTLAPVPVVSKVAVAGLAGRSPIASYGTTLTISGRQLACEDNTATGAFAPTELAGTIVHLDGRRLGLLSVSSTQIRAQARPRTRGTARLTVTTPNGWTETTVRV